MDARKGCEVALALTGAFAFSFSRLAGGVRIRVGGMASRIGRGCAAECKSLAEPIPAKMQEQSAESHIGLGENAPSHGVWHSLLCRSDGPPSWACLRCS